MIPFGKDIDAAAERHYDRMLAAHQREDGPEPECSNCHWWNEDTGICDRLLADLPEEQLDEDAATEPDCYCEDYEPQEQDEWEPDPDEAWESRFDMEEPEE